MLEWLLNLDRAVFMLINAGLANPVTDVLMPIVTGDNLLRLLYATAMVAMLVFGRRRFVWVVVFSALVVLLTDQSSSTWLKPAIERMRPCKVMEVHLLVGCGAGYSFPSSHATNLFGQAVFFGLLYKKYLPYLLGFAFLVSVSRIFVGVHYPLDMIGGMILGTIIGLAGVLTLRTLVRNGVLKPAPLVRIDTMRQERSGG